MNRVVSNALDNDFEPNNLHLDNNESLNNLLNFFQSKDLSVDKVRASKDTGIGR